MLTGCKKEKGLNVTIDEPPKKDLVVYLPFDGNTKDYSGFENHGSPYNIQFGENEKGEKLKVAIIDGSGSFISIKPSGIFSFGKSDDFTISLKVKVGSQKNTAGLENFVLSKSASDLAYPFTIRLFNQRHTRPFTWYAARLDGGSCKRRSTSSSGNIIAGDNKWHHLVFVKNSRTLIIYQDGIELARASDNSQCEILNNEPLYIGCQGPGRINGWFNGQIDNFRIYQRALIDSEIQALYKE